MFHRPIEFDGNGAGSAEGLLRITRSLSPLVDKATIEVFRTHAQRLMTESVDYIIPAVWGAKKDGFLDETQQEIHKAVGPLIQAILEELNIRGLTVAQEFALGYLIREIIVSKMMFLIAMAGNEVLKMIWMTDHTDGYLRTIEPSGNA